MLFLLGIIVVGLSLAVLATIMASFLGAYKAPPESIKWVDGERGEAHEPRKFKVPSSLNPEQMRAGIKKPLKLFRIPNWMD